MAPIKNECKWYSITLARNLNNFTCQYAVKYPVLCSEHCDGTCVYSKINKYISGNATIQERDKDLLQLFNLYHLSLKKNWLTDVSDYIKQEIMANFLDENRTLFVRERERILCTESFRRLQYKTQVMVNSVSDDQRTRLLHSIEVQNISRKIAIGLKANYELAETIALAHDIGHAPFGHAGEKAIDKYLQKHYAGNFSHAVQSVKVIDFLCSHRFLKPRGLFGLGVSEYVLEGILKHDSDSFSQDVSRAAFRLQYDCPSLYPSVGVELNEISDSKGIRIGGIETQIAYWADKIAYKGHDWEEFVQVGLLEKMLERVNSIVIEMHRIVEVSENRSVFSFDDKHNAELKQIKDIIEKLKDFHATLSEFAADKNTDEFQEKFKSKLHALIVAISEIYKNGNYCFFSKEQYDLLNDYFSIAEAWIEITKIYPTVNGGKFDTIFVIYDYLANTTSHRITPNMIQLLINDTNDSINIIAETQGIKAEEITRELYIEICNNNYDNNKNPKQKLYKNFIVKYSDDNSNYVDKITDFINKQFIKSTRINFMTLTAETIINGLLSFYQEHPEMLPLKQRNRIAFEQKENDKIAALLQEYYLEEDNTGKYKHNNEECVSFIINESEKYDTDFAEKIKEIYNCKKENPILREMGYKTIIDTLFSATNVKNHFVNNVISLRVIVDYVSGMTDRMAEKKYNEIVSSATNWSKEYSEMATFNA